LDKNEMNIIREILRTVLMLLGAILFVAALAPVLNPAMFESAIRKTPVPALHWIECVLPLSILMLIGAWLLNPKKQMPRQRKKRVQPSGGEEHR